MSEQMKDLVRLAASGKINRRAFVGRMGALGLSASVAGSMFGMVAHAEAKKGGTLRAGVQGGQSTDSLDPALAASDVPFMINMTWGETLVEIEPGGVLGMRVAEEVSSNADATEWKFKIRAGMTFHNGAPVTAEDVVATLKRHTDEKSQSGAAGVVKGIAEMSSEGDMVTLKLAAANADLPYLMADYHLIIQPGGGVSTIRRPASAAAPIWSRNSNPACAASWRSSPAIGMPRAGMPMWSRSCRSTTTPPGRRPSPPVRSI